MSKREEKHQQQASLRRVKSAQSRASTSDLYMAECHLMLNKPSPFSLRRWLRHLANSMTESRKAKKEDFAPKRVRRTTETELANYNKNKN